MKDNPLFRLFFLIFSVLNLSGCWLLGDRIPNLHFYSANILMKGGEPCFNLKDHRKKWVDPPEISRIDVFLYPDKTMIPMWSHDFSADRVSVRLNAFECIVYGEGAEEAPPLQKGLSYRVLISGHKNGEVMNYSAHFRLYETADGETDICRLKWNDEIRGYDLEACDHDGHRPDTSGVRRNERKNRHSQREIRK